ncbi:MAG: hypothetical protein LC749_22225, partial [Actinobacteria bacterium]|nr:hypothetical protein [Actinomycetota bacterium]
WQRKAVQTLTDRGADRPTALASMLRGYIEHMHSNQPVHTWPLPGLRPQNRKAGLTFEVPHHPPGRPTRARPPGRAQRASPDRAGKRARRRTHPSTRRR